MGKFIISSLMVGCFVIGMAGISSAILVSEETLAEDVVLSLGLQWNQIIFGEASSVYNQGNSIALDFGGTFNVNNYIIQASDNGGNTLLYRDLSFPGISYPVWEIPNDDNGFIRMLILPKAYDNTGDSSPGSATVTESFELFGQPLDGKPNSLVSRIQEDGAPVPEPATMFLFGIGLTGLSKIRSRRNLA